MPKVDPDSGDMMSDDPNLESDGERGGKQGADLPEGANPMGSDSAASEAMSPDADAKPTTGQ